MMQQQGFNNSALACMLLMEKSASCRVLPRVRPFAKMPAGKRSYTRQDPTAEEIAADYQLISIC